MDTPTYVKTKLNLVKRNFYKAFGWSVDTLMKVLYFGGIPLSVMYGK